MGLRANATGKQLGKARCSSLLGCTLLLVCSALVAPNISSSQAPPSAVAPPTEASSRGTKLVLKDGNYQLVRSYKHEGERVRYYSVERAAWEEIPASMVDWDATAKAATDEKTKEEALVAKVHAQTEAQRVQPVLDVDASLQLAAGVFLPQGEGMFLFSDTTVVPLGQVGSDVKTDKKTVLKQVLSPIPIVASKQNVVLEGAHAKIRVVLTKGNPEFFLREPAAGPDTETTIKKSARGGENGPEVELIRATVKGHQRRLESVRSMFGEKLSTDSQIVALQRWETAPSVYRFTLSQPLEPGEYALAEILPDGMNLFVWDFAVDAAVNAGKK